MNAPTSLDERGFRRFPGVVSGLWFFCFGALAAFLCLAFFSRNPPTAASGPEDLFPFVFQPAFSAGLWGLAAGPIILKARSAVLSCGLGVAISVFSLPTTALFMALFSFPESLLSLSGLGEVVGLSFFFLFFGVVAFGWILVPFGALAGFCLHLLLFRRLWSASRVPTMSRDYALTGRHLLRG